MARRNQVKVGLSNVEFRKGEIERAKSELNEAWKYPFYRSVAAIKADPNYADPRVWPMAEASFVAGLRVAGMPEN